MAQLKYTVNLPTGKFGNSSYTDLQWWLIDVFGSEGHEWALTDIYELRFRRKKYVTLFMLKWGI